MYRNELEALLSIEILVSVHRRRGDRKTREGEEGERTKFDPFSGILYNARQQPLRYRIDPTTHSSLFVRIRKAFPRQKTCWVCNRGGVVVGEGTGRDVACL